MKLPDPRSRATVGANMTPMIDVVFLLIIFFLVSSHLAKQESRMPLDVPAARASADADTERQALTININTDAEVLVLGKSVGEADLRAVLADHVTRDGDAAAIRIRTDRNAEYRTVRPVLRTAAALGITDVSLSVRSATSTNVPTAGNR